MLKDFVSEYFVSFHICLERFVYEWHIALATPRSTRIPNLSSGERIEFALTTTTTTTNGGLSASGETAASSHIRRPFILPITRRNSRKRSRHYYGNFQQRSTATQCCERSICFEWKKRTQFLSSIRQWQAANDDHCSSATALDSVRTQSTAAAQSFMNQ